MRMAVPVIEGVLNPHFGDSRLFWIADVGGDPVQVANARVVTVPDGAGCGGIAALLAQEKVGVVIAGGIGAGAVDKLGQCGIRVVTGAPSGPPPQIAAAYLQGELTGSGATCEAHGHGHQHQHRHGQEHGHRHDHGHGHGCCHGPRSA